MEMRRTRQTPTHKKSASRLSATDFTPILRSPDENCSNPIFFTDLPQISQVLPGFSFSRQRSSWSEVRGYPKNVEIQVAVNVHDLCVLSADLLHRREPVGQHLVLGGNFCLGEHSAVDADLVQPAFQREVLVLVVVDGGVAGTTLFPRLVLDQHGVPLVLDRLVQLSPDSLERLDQPVIDEQLRSTNQPGLADRGVVDILEETGRDFYRGRDGLLRNDRPFAPRRIWLRNAPRCYVRRA